MIKGKGLFITFEGIDATGKSTQAKLFYDYLKAQGNYVRFAKCPGDSEHGSSIGQSIRDIVFSDSYTHDLSRSVKSLLFLADNIAMQEQLVDPRAYNEWIVSDRYIDSQLAFWDTPENNPIRKLTRELFTTKPDITFLFIGSPQLCYKRANNRSESEVAKQQAKPWNNVSDLTKIQTNYMKELCPQDRTIVIFIDDSDSIPQVQSKVQKAFTEWQSKRNELTNE